MIKYKKSDLVFSRKENIREYLIYTARDRGVYIVPKIVWSVFESCTDKTAREISKKTKLPLQTVNKILILLFKRRAVKKIY